MSGKFVSRKTGVFLRQIIICLITFDFVHPFKSEHAIGFCQQKLALLRQNVRC